MSNWTPELMIQVRDITQVRVSPDGTKVVYAVMHPVMTEERSENVTEIYLAETDGSREVQLTFADKVSNNPQWSPDGRWIAFTSKRAGKANLYRLRADGGEAEQLTDVKSDIVNFAWSPDAGRLAYIQPDPPAEEEEKREKAKDDWRWVDEDLKMNRIHLISVEKDAEGKREPRALTDGSAHVDGSVAFGLDWSPDGKEIAFTHQKTPSEDVWPTSRVSVINVKTGEQRLQITSAGAAVTHPLYSPDGKWICVNITDDPPRWAFQSKLHVVPVGGGVPRPLGETHDSQPTPVGWSADSKKVFYWEYAGITTKFYAMDIESGNSQVICGGTGCSLEYNVNRAATVAAYPYQTPIRAKEVFALKLDGGTPTQVSHVNEKLSGVPVGKTEAVRWKSTEDFEIEGLLTYPVNYQAEQRVPLMLVIHGGPTGVFVENFVGNHYVYPVAAFNELGYAVLRCNPRGSSGYGRDFRYANQKDWGGGDYRDLMAGVDHVIGMGVADPDRLGVMGWSYGGFMTSWTITQTNRFKAASVGAAVTNLMSFNGTADIPSFIPDYFGAQSWEDLEAYRDHSAMFNVGGVTTPSLIQHGENDVRVPISQGYEFYNALKAQCVPVRMLVLPRQPHGPDEPRMKLKVMQTNVEWFKKYIG